MTCKNCKTEFTDDKDFCSSCGAKVIRNRLTLKALFSHFNEQFLNYDNKFLQTFIHLFTKPEVVIGSYINGTRKKYVNAISYFAIAITLSGIHLFILRKIFPDTLDFSSMIPEGQEEFQEKIKNISLEYQSFLMMLTIPIYALTSKIVFYNIKKYNYTEHLVLFMYIIAQMAILAVLTGVLGAFFGVASWVIEVFNYPIIVLYTAYCLKRVYNLTIKRIIIKTLFFILIFSLFFILFEILFLIVLYATGNIDMIINTQQIPTGS